MSVRMIYKTLLSVQECKSDKDYITRLNGLNDWCDYQILAIQILTNWVK